nr:immunoglobulin light chain junction region [Macaca mulatta]
CMIWHNNVALF